MGRKSNATKVVEQLAHIASNAAGNDFVLPNHSGYHDAGRARTPVNEDDLVNKDYVDSVAGRGSLDLFLTENASDIGSYFDLEVDIVLDAKENIIQSITANSTTLIASFASKLADTTVNEIRLLEGGIYNMHIHAEGVVAKNLFVYFEFYHRTSGGTETLLGTSHDSSELGTSEEAREMHAIITTDKAFVSGDRIVVKIYGRNKSAAARNITIYMEGDTAARIEFPALSNVSSGLWEVDGSETQLKTADEIDMQNHKIINLATSTNNADAANKGYVDGAIVTANLWNVPTGDMQMKSAVDLDMQTQTIKGVVDPTSDQEAATKKYVDDNESDTTDHTALSNIGTTNHTTIDSTLIALIAHTNDNTQAHSDYLKNDAADVGVKLTLTGDNASADTAYVPMVLYNTDDTPPAASGFPIGTLYVQYTA